MRQLPLVPGNVFATYSRWQTINVIRVMKRANFTFSTCVVYLVAAITSVIEILKCPTSILLNVFVYLELTGVHSKSFRCNTNLWSTNWSCQIYWHDSRNKINRWMLFQHVSVENYWVETLFVGSWFGKILTQGRLHAWYIGELKWCWDNRFVDFYFYEFFKLDCFTLIVKRRNVNTAFNQLLEVYKLLLRYINLIQCNFPIAAAQKYI